LPRDPSPRSAPRTAAPPLHPPKSRNDFQSLLILSIVPFALACSWITSPMIYWNLILSKPKKWPPLFLSPDDKALCACARARIRGERRAAPSSMVGVLFLSLPLLLRLACALRLAVVVVKLILSSRGGVRIAFSHFDLVFFDYFHVNKRLCKAPTRCKWKKNLTSFFVSSFSHVLFIYCSEKYS